MKKIRQVLICITIISLILMPTCTKKSKDSKDKEEVNLLVAAAASMEYSLDKLVNMFEVEYPLINVEVTYDSSGKLQRQIEEGLEADVFFSAGMKQMIELKEQGLVDGDSVVELLENKLVLIGPAIGDSKVTSFKTVLDANIIAIGDPSSVPAGQYAANILTNMGIYEEVLEKASLASNVTQVLNWVGEGSADVGLVYSTDAITTEKVRVVEEAPKESLDTRIIYPLGLVSTSNNKEAASIFIEYLQSSAALRVFEEFGFSIAN